MQRPAVLLLQKAQRWWRLTIVGGVRERPGVTRRGRGKTVCARGAWLALLGGPSTSPLGERNATRCGRSFVSGGNWGQRLCISLTRERYEPLEQRGWTLLPRRLVVAFALGSSCVFVDWWLRRYCAGPLAPRCRDTAAHFWTSGIHNCDGVSYGLSNVCLCVRLTIVGGVRERPVCPRRGRGRDRAPAALDQELLGGPSTSPLDRISEAHREHSARRPGWGRRRMGCQRAA